MLRHSCYSCHPQIIKIKHARDVHGHMIIDVTGFGRGSLKKGFGCICIVAVVCVMSHRLLLVKKGESETI